MSSTRLIDAIVRQTTVLLATLATASGQRATLARVANQVFGDLVGELKQQGLGNKVIADMFGLALRTYHKKVARLGESQSFRGQSIWEAVLALVAQQGTMLRADVLARFGADEEAVVRGVLSDLTDSGLLFRTGAGDRTSYRAARADELPALPDKGEVLAQLVLVALHQHGPATLSQCAERVAMEEPELSQILALLVEDGRAQRTEHGGTARYRCDHVMIGYHDPNGWQAAVYDHYQALVGALCHKLQLSLTHATPDEHVGGSTYTFDLWRGHAYEHEVLGLLSRLRREAVALRQRVEAYNRDQSSPDDEQRFRVVAYVGQNTIGYEQETPDND
jgi:DNA-binding MarR family transcriptional regulator